MNYLILTVGTIFIILFSWFFSIKQKRYHGIARFFAFESIFIMVLLNLPVWFKNPFSSMQVISWVLMCSSIYPAISGFMLLKKVGKPGANLETTTVLVREGLYRYIRHPLYFSLFLFGTGVAFKGTGYEQVILALVNLTALFFTAKLEEKEMIIRFGDEYKKYMTETKMFLPYIL